MQSENIDKLAEALAKAQGEFPVLEKKSQAHNYKYADLAETISATQDPLSKNGLSISHEIVLDEPPFLKTTLMHSSNQWKDTPVPLFFKADGRINQMQAFGSAVTYAKRYAIGCLLNLAADKEIDDDGKSACNPKQDVHYVMEKVELPKVSAEQAEKIERYLAEFPESKKDMLARYGASSVSEIPADKFKQIVFIFESKKNKFKEVG
jgi:ERF superfamily